MKPTEKLTTRTGSEIAIIGMAGKFPGAGNIDELWDNLKNGIESIAFITKEELMEAGANTDFINNPNHVKSLGGFLEEGGLFDAHFFGYTPEEAGVMEPQMRIFHECAYEALENAACDVERYNGLIGVYAGASSSTYWEAWTKLSGKAEQLGIQTASSLIKSDLLASRISYRLNLKGPAFMVQSACSTSLLAVHLACQGILNGDCNIAMAGGVRVETQVNNGYLYQEGFIMSPDGHCRAFDAKAKGAIPGNGLGIVVLKLLEEAIGDRDYIHAVIRGTAVNNDGKEKVGYTAPGIEGQAAVIQTCHQVAEVEPESIGYIETHGTGTVLGDPVEIEALKMVFNTDKKGFCSIGSIKTNIGHLDAGAGIAGLIKAVLALKYKLIPPSLHYETPNPKIDFENSPFYVNTKSREWNNGNYPLRAGVSSFGIGGTNVHAILEESPVTYPSSSVNGNKREHHLILLSAKTESALDKMTENFVKYLKTHPDTNLADAAYTLQLGREAFQYRKMLVCSNIDDAIDTLTASSSRRVRTSFYPLSYDIRVSIFMFSGLGAQYVNMGYDLYTAVPLFQEIMDSCFGILEPLVGYDIKEILYPRDSVSKVSGALENEKINQPEIAQLVIFIFEYALAKLFMHWGIKPQAMIGYSFGEYAAACISGVFSIEDALKLIMHRGELVKQAPTGLMLNVPLPVKELALWLPHDLSMAIDNGESCVVAGPNDAIMRFEQRLKEKKILGMRLPASRAPHSKMMNPITKKLQEYLEHIPLNKPQIPFISNITGKFITPEMAASPAYWAEHLKATVQFSAGIGELINQKENPIFIEIGPGYDLCSLVKRYLEHSVNHPVVNLIRPSRQKAADVSYLLNKIGQLWLYGKNIDWHEFYKTEIRYRMPLPSYPFERQKYQARADVVKMISKMTQGTSQTGLKQGMPDWFYVPSWERSLLPAREGENLEKSSYWLVFTDGYGLAARLLKLLEPGQVEIITVEAGKTFESHNRTYVINPRRSEDYDALFKELRELNRVPGKILHYWGVTGNNPGRVDLEELDGALDLGLFSLLNIAQAIGRQTITSEMEIAVVTSNMQEVTGGELLCPVKAAILGPIKIIPLEYRNIKCRSIDIDLRESRQDHLPHLLLEEFKANTPDVVVAYRGSYRWAQILKPHRLNKPGRLVPPLRDKGVYLVTGGLGGMGFTLAGHLAENLKARLILVGRSHFPGRDNWQKWLETHDHEDPVSFKIRKIRELEEKGSEFMVFSVDVSNYEEMKDLVDRAEKQLGPINGVLHTAGVIDYDGVIQRRTRQMTENGIAAKVMGTLVLDRLLNHRDKKLDLFILFSSIGNFVYGVKFGQVAYNAANEFLDAFTLYNGHPHDTQVTTINWTDWKEVGMAVNARLQIGHDTSDLETPSADTLSNQEGIEVFEYILGSRLPRVAVSTKDLLVTMKQTNKWKNKEVYNLDRDDRQSPPAALYKRPTLSTTYAAPRNNIEQELVHTFQNFFGIDQVGIYDDFFELGGDSLKAITIVSRIYKKMEVEVPIAEFFTRPTIKSLAEYIDNSQTSNFYSIQPVEDKEYYTISSAQKRLYILQQMETGNISYNMPQMMPLAEDIERNKLENTFKKLISRHDSLRTSFYMVADEPVQKVHQEVEFKIEYFDMKEVKVEVEENEGIQGVALFPGESHHSLIVRPFDLIHAPLLRVGLIKTVENHHILLVDIHHIISDGISNEILEKDFIALYEGKDLPPLRIQYKDFSQWQNRQKEKENLKQQEIYWLGKFAGEIPVLNLPTDYPRPAIQGFAGEVINFNIPHDKTLGLKEIVLQEKVTLYMVLLSVFNILLSRLSNQEDIIVGTPIACRRHADLESIIGIFVNTLALRTCPIGEKTFQQFLSEVKTQTLEAFENQEYQFEDLVEKVAVHRDTSRNPLFDVMFSLQDLEIQTGNIPAAETPELNLLLSKYKSTASKFDITLRAAESGELLILSFNYSTELFKQETIARFIRYFNRIVFSIINSNEKKISEIEIMSLEEKKQILFEFNDTRVGYPGDKTIHELFEEQVERTPDHMALLGQIPKGVAPPSCKKIQIPNKEVPFGQFVNAIGEVYLSYGELNEKSQRLACLLEEKGVGPDIIVGIMMEPSVEMIVGIFGTLKAGAAYMPINPDYPQERIKYMLADSNANVLVTTSTLAREVKKFRSLEVKKNFEVIFIDSFEFYSCSSSHLLIFSNSHSSNLAYVIYTSGTTGKPKGVLLKHENLVNYVAWFSRAAGLTNEDKTPLTSSFAFDLGYTSIYPSLLAGGQLHILTRETYMMAEKLLEYIINHRISYMKMTPSLFSIIVNDTHFSLKAARALSLVVLGGEAINLTDVEKAYHVSRHLKVMNHYGPTEATIGCVAQMTDLAGFEAYKKNTAIGKPVSNCKVYILDRYLKPLPWNIAGELCVGGVCLGRGYLNQPQLTSERFINYKLQNTKHNGGGTTSLLGIPNCNVQNNKPGGIHSISNHAAMHLSHHSLIYLTGDLARWLTDGNIEFIGRIDHQVKIRGYRIELGEIESQLLKCDMVTETIVMAVESSGTPGVKGATLSDQRLVAYVVPGKEKHRLSLAQLIGNMKEFLKENLPGYMIPHTFVLLDNFPLTPNGKLDRKALPQPQQMGDGKAYVGPVGEGEVKLTEIWSEVLGIEKELISMDANFFDLGGHSLMATRLISLVHKKFNVKVPLVEIFKRPTIADLSRYINEASENIHAAIMPLEKREYYPLSSAQKRMFILDRFKGDGTSDNTPGAMTVEGKLDIPSFENAIKGLFRRHEALRTSFELLDNAPIQRIHHSVNFEISYRAAAEDQIEGIMKDFIHHFNLSSAPLIRVGLIKVSQVNYIIWFDMHHIISDGTSKAILMNDFIALYNHMKLPLLRIQYKDFTHWHNKRLESPTLKKQEEYWLRIFSKDIPVLNMPTDYPRPAVQSYEGDYITFELDRVLTKKINEMAFDTGTTLYMVLLTIYNILFSKYSQQEDIVVGTSIAGRLHADLENIIGFFVNTLAMRNYPLGEKTFLEFLKEVKDNCLRAYENQDYQFENLVNKLGIKRDSSRDSLFNVHFTVQNLLNTGSFPESKLEDLRFSLHKFEEKVTQFDIIIHAFEVGDMISFKLRYCTKLFKREMIERFINYFHEVVSLVIDNKNIKLKDIEISHSYGIAKSVLLQEQNDDFGF